MGHIWHHYMEIVGNYVDPTCDIEISALALVLNSEKTLHIVFSV